MPDVSLKEFIEVKFQGFESQLAGFKEVMMLELKAIRAESEEDKKQTSKRRHETLALVTEIKAKHEEHEKEMEKRDEKQKVINNRIYIWLSILSVLIVFSLIGLASEAGSLLGIIINAF